MRFLLLLQAVVGVTYAVTGFDGIGGISSSQFSCMKSHGYSFYIGRVFRSSGHVDTQGMQDMRNAWAGGMSHVDGYIFPCVTCSTPPATQVSEAIAALKSTGTKYGQIWLDIERYKWSSSLTTNRNFITAMANELNALGVSWGIYTNYYNWQEIVGLDWTAMSHKPLWWAKYNGQANLNSFTAFGGWSKPNIHQYSGDVTGPCSFSIDQNYYP